MTVRRYPLQSTLGISLKYGLLAHHCLFLLILCVFIGFGSWLFLWTNSYTLFGIITKTYYYATGRVLLLLTSLIAIFAIVFGCCVINSELPTLILVQVTLMFVLSGMFLGTAVCGFQMFAELRHTLPQKFTAAITKYYGINMNRPRNRELTDTIDSIQIQFGCCGVSGRRDSNGSWFLYRGRSAWYYLSLTDEIRESPPYVPDSCCVFRGQYESFTSFEESKVDYDTIVNRPICVGENVASTTATMAPIASNPVRIDGSNKYIHEDGCLTVTFNTYKYYALLLAGLGMAGTVFCILGIILSSLLLWCIEYEQCIRMLNEKTAKQSIQTSVDFDSVYEETTSETSEPV